ncbi:MAG TPA: hypothetical protein VMV52_10640 [Candidatus Nanopelagicaceae bacterium]|nr:hypothetical protein [Candidatus Nanopelagicaceae bacterium]
MKTRGKTYKRLATVLVTGWLALMPAIPAFAHGGGDSNQSRILVLDALAYLANKPADYMDLVTDKVNDAIEAEDPSGVTIEQVVAAQQALEAGDMTQVRTLLQSSLQPLTEPVVGEDVGTTTMLDPLGFTTKWTGSTGSFGLISLLALISGTLFAIRWRPKVTIKELLSHLMEQEKS